MFDLTEEQQTHASGVFDDWGRDTGLKRKGLIVNHVGNDPSEQTERAGFMLERLANGEDTE